jgi:hypothetical protein
MNFKYRRLTVEQIELLKSLLAHAATNGNAKELGISDFDAYYQELKDIYDALTMDELGLDALVKENHNLRNEIQKLKLMHVKEL